MKKFWCKNNIILICVVVGLIIIDQLTKALFTNVEAQVFGELLQISYVQNTGAAFSILSGNVWLFILLSCIFIIFLFVFYFLSKSKPIILTLSISLLVGGAVGNLIDRIFLGFVKDFIYISFFPAIFNFADVFVTIGTIMLIVYVLFYFEKGKKSGN